jgi:hypothetical protein
MIYCVKTQELITELQTRVTQSLTTEPSSFARLRRADSEMKHVKNRDFFDMFLRRGGSDRVVHPTLNLFLNSSRSVA